MKRTYGYDIIDGRRVPHLVIKGDHVLDGEHSGTVHVEAGTFILGGTLNGTLDIQRGVMADIRGRQRGTVGIEGGAEVRVGGSIEGTTSVAGGALLIVEDGGKLAGTLNNDGRVVIRGVFGGARSGSGVLLLEGPGYIKEPTVRDGVHYYDWSDS